MTPMEYTIRKNAILFDLTGVVLVPANQIKDVEPIKMQEETKPNRINDGKICPYCLVYLSFGNEPEKETSCEDCPMGKANNRCDEDKDDNEGTYMHVRHILRSKGLIISSIGELLEIQALVKEYNQQFD